MRDAIERLRLERWLAIWLTVFALIFSAAVQALSKSFVQDREGSKTTTVGLVDPT